MSLAGPDCFLAGARLRDERQPTVVGHSFRSPPSLNADDLTRRIGPRRAGRMPPALAAIRTEVGPANRLSPDGVWDPTREPGLPVGRRASRLVLLVASVNRLVRTHMKGNWRDAQNDVCGRAFSSSSIRAATDRLLADGADRQV